MPGLKCALAIDAINSDDIFLNIFLASHSRYSHMYCPSLWNNYNGMFILYILVTNFENIRSASDSVDHLYYCP